MYVPSDLQEYSTPLDNKILAFVNIIPESIPCQRQISQELSGVQMKAPSPSQTAETLHLLIKKSMIIKIDGTVYITSGQGDCYSNYSLQFFILKKLLLKKLKS